MANSKDLKLKLKVIFDADGTALLKTQKEFDSLQKELTKSRQKEKDIVAGISDELRKQLNIEDGLKSSLQKLNEEQQAKRRDINRQVDAYNKKVSEGLATEEKLKETLQDELSLDNQILKNINDKINQTKKLLDGQRQLVDEKRREGQVDKENERNRKEAEAASVRKSLGGYNFGQARRTSSSPIPEGFDYIRGGNAEENVNQIKRRKDELSKTEKEISDRREAEYKKEIQQYREQTKERIRLEQQKIAILDALNREGADSLTAIRLKQQEKELQIKRKASADLQEIERQLVASEIDLTEASRRRTSVLRDETAAIVANNQATAHQLSTARGASPSSSPSSSSSSSGMNMDRLSQYSRETRPDGMNIASLSRYSREWRTVSNIIGENTVRVAENARQYQNLFVRVLEITSIHGLINRFKDAIMGIPAAGIELESTIASLTATAGGSGGMGSVLEALRGEADRTGISIKTLRETFRGFQASTSLAGESMSSTWKMFTELNTVITGLHLPSDKANGIFLAMAQIFNKTKVQSEELVKQLGNLLPGAFASFAAANNVAFGGQFKNSLDLIVQMKKGLVFAHDTMGNFTQYLAERFAPAFALASHSLNSEVGRLKTSFTLLQESIYTTSSEYIVGSVRNLTKLLDAFRGAVDGTNQLGHTIRNVGIVALGLFSTYILKAILSSIRLRAETIILAATVDSQAAATLRAAAASHTLAGGVIASTVAMNALKTALAFVSSPVFVFTAFFTGISLLINAYQKARKPIDDVNELLQQSKENLEAIAKEPVTLELRVDADPEVKKALADMKALQDYRDELKNSLETKHRSAFLTSLVDNSIVKSIREGQLKESEDKIKELGDLLVVLREKAAITLELETGQALVDMQEISSKMKELALQAQGFTEEAARMNFEHTYASQMAKVEKVTNEAERLVYSTTPTSIISGSLPSSISGQKGAAPLSISGSIDSFQNLSNTVKQVDIWKAEVERLQKLNTLTEEQTKLASIYMDKIKTYNESVETKSNYEIAKNSSAIKRRDADNIKSINNRLEAEERAYGKAKTLEDVTSQARIKAKLHENELLKQVTEEQNNLNYRAKDKNYKSSEEYAKKQKELDERKKLIEIGTAKEISDAQEAFLKQNKESNSSALDTETQDVKRFYKDYIRDAKNASKEIAFSIQTVEWEFEDKAISAEEYFRKKNALQDKDLAQQRKATEEALALAQSVNDVNLVMEYTDKLEGLTDEQKNLNFQRERENKLLIFKQQLDKINLETSQKLNALNLQSAVTNNKYLSGLLHETEYLEELNKIKQKELQNIWEEIKAKTALANLPTTSPAKREELQNEIDGLKTQVTQKSLSGTTVKDVMGLKGTDQISNLVNSASTVNKSLTDLEGNKTAEKNNVMEKADNESLRFLMGAKDVDPVETYRKQNEDLLKIDEQYAQASFVIRSESFGNIMGSGADAFASLTSSMQAYYGADSEAAQAAFIAYKAFKISEIMITTALLAMKLAASQADIPIIGPFTAASMIPFAYAMGAVQIAAVMAQPMPAAHGGLTNVPEEQTYLLNKGERVLSPKQNTDFTDYLNRKKESTSDGQTQNNVYNISVTVQGSKDDKPSDTGNKVAESAMRAIAKQEITNASRLGNKLNKITAF